MTRLLISSRSCTAVYPEEHACFETKACIASRVGKVSPLSSTFAPPNPFEPAEFCWPLSISLALGGLFLHLLD